MTPHLLKKKIPENLATSKTSLKEKNKKSNQQLTRKCDWWIGRTQLAADLSVKAGCLQSQQAQKVGPQGGTGTARDFEELGGWGGGCYVLS